MRCRICALTLPDGASTCAGCGEPVLPPIRFTPRDPSEARVGQIDGETVPPTARPMSTSYVPVPDLLPEAPTVRACYAHAWRQFGRHYLRLLLVGFVCFVVLAVGSALGGQIAVIDSPFSETSWATLLSASPIGASVDLVDAAVRVLFAPDVPGDVGGGSRSPSPGLLWYKLLVLWPASYGLQLAFLKAARGERPRVRDLFDTYSRLQSVFAILAVAAVLVLVSLPSNLFSAVSRSLDPSGDESLLGVVAFVLGIPSFVVGLRLLFVPFLILDESIGAVAAVKESWRRTIGYTWTIIWAWLLTIAIQLLGLLLLIVEIIPALIITSLVYPSLYLAISANPKTARARS